MIFKFLNIVSIYLVLTSTGCLKFSKETSDSKNTSNKTNTLSNDDESRLKQRKVKWNKLIFDKNFDWSTKKMSL